MNPAIHYIKQSLHGYYPDTELMAMAKLLLTQVFDLSVIDLYAGKDNGFSEKEWKQLDDILLRLKKQEPIQYIIGVEEFCGLSFEVNPDVLIPRPETAELIDWIVKDHPEEGLRVLDIGTGSGCIAISLKKKLRKADVTSWDVSAAALQTAARNCQRNEVYVRLQQQDILQESSSDGSYDLLVSNPPYITEKEKTDMEKNVLDWEPEIALFVPDEDPLLFYREIAKRGKRLLVPGGELYVEINQAYGRQTMELLEQLGYKELELKQDLSQRDRMIKAVR